MRKRQIFGFVVVVAVVGALFLLPEKVSEQWKGQALTVLSPFFKGISWLKFQFQGVSDDLKTIDQIKKENLRLHAETAQLRAENQTFRNLEKENEDLKAALKFQRSSPFRLLIARVIAREPSSWWQYITIDRGSEDGLDPTRDQAVVTPKGLVGKTVPGSITDGTAKVVLLGDENCRISATLDGTNEQGIVQGEPTATGQVQCRMTFISRTASIDIGQRVYTSGLGGVFPPGLLIGEVVDLVPVGNSSGFGLYREVVIKPAAELSNIQDVFVVISGKPSP